MRPGTVVTLTGSSVALLVLVYAFVLVPLELGLGLIGGYRAIGPLGLGALGLLIWLVLATLVVGKARRRVERDASRPRTILYALLVGSVVTLTSYPLVVVWVYIGIHYSETPAVPRDQIIFIVAANWLYTWALALTAIVLLVSLAALVALRIRRARARTRP